MAADLFIGRHWFHSGRLPHYDIPVSRQAGIEARCVVVSTREFIGENQDGQGREGSSMSRIMDVEIVERDDWDRALDRSLTPMKAYAARNSTTSCVTPSSRTSR
jgi:hypothetical protein